MLRSLQYLLFILCRYSDQPFHIIIEIVNIDTPLYPSIPIQYCMNISLIKIFYYEFLDQDWFTKLEWQKPIASSNEFMVRPFDDQAVGIVDFSHFSKYLIRSFQSHKIVYLERSQKYIFIIDIQVNFLVLRQYRVIFDISNI